MPRRPKTGGRQKGTPNRRTAELHREVAKTGLTPLDHMLEVMRDPKAEPARQQGDPGEAGETSTEACGLRGE